MAQYPFFEFTNPTDDYLITINNNSYTGTLPYENNSLSEGQYNLSVMNSVGCLWDTSFVIESQFEPIIEMVSYINILAGDSVQLNAITNIPFPQSISWSPYIGLSCTDCLSPIVAPERTTSYTLTVVDASGCTANASISIIVENPDNNVFIPNVIAPNSNTGNNVFMLYSDKNYISDYKLTIYNRWGDVIYSKSGLRPNSPDGGWDGTFNGQLLSPEVFVYTIEANVYNSAKMKYYSGDVTILN